MQSSITMCTARPSSHTSLIATILKGGGERLAVVGARSCRPAPTHPCAPPSTSSPPSSDKEKGASAGRTCAAASSRSSVAVPPPRLRGGATAAAELVAAGELLPNLRTRSPCSSPRHRDPRPHPATTRRRWRLAGAWKERVRGDLTGVMEGGLPKWCRWRGAAPAGAWKRRRRRRHGRVEEEAAPRRRRWERERREMDR
uniref:Uncharacterized protein n=1 Tax=Oryza meridionalis TaxID=40149 RepID=A0A0E0DFU0_9ORYZ